MLQLPSCPHVQYLHACIIVVLPLLCQGIYVFLDTVHAFMSVLCMFRLVFNNAAQCISIILVFLLYYDVLNDVHSNINFCMPIEDLNNFIILMLYSFFGSLCSISPGITDEK